MGRLFVVLGIVGLLTGFLVTLHGMVQTFESVAESPGARPQELASGISDAISWAFVASVGGTSAAAVLLPLGIVLLILARRARNRYQS